MAQPRTPHPYVASRFEHQLELVRPSRERANAPSLASHYVLRVFRDNDAPAYDELFHLAWPDEDTLAHTRKHALTDGFLVVEEVASGLLVASCVAFGPETPRHPFDGSLGWLVVDPAHGGRGIGTVIAAAVTNLLLDESYALPWLGTEDDRLAAIALYRRLGWQPHLYADDMEPRWRTIGDRLGRAFSIDDCVSS